MNKIERAARPVLMKQQGRIVAKAWVKEPDKPWVFRQLTNEEWNRIIQLELAGEAI